MHHLATIRTVARRLRARGVPPALADDAAASAWLAAWERGGAMNVRHLALAARRLTIPGRGGASRAVVGLPVVDEPHEPSGRNVCPALDDLIDAATVAGSSTADALEALRRAGCSLADIGDACGVSGEAVRKWAAGAEPAPAARRRLMDAAASLAH